MLYTLFGELIRDSRDVIGLRYFFLWVKGPEVPVMCIMTMNAWLFMLVTIISVNVYCRPIRVINELIGHIPEMVLHVFILQRCIRYMKSNMFGNAFKP